MSRPPREQVFLEIATSMAKRSTCLRRAVGCVLVNSRGHVLATGYNGVASGMPHCNHREYELYKSEFEFKGRVDKLSERGIQHKVTPGNDYFHVEFFPNSCPAANASRGMNLGGCEAIHAEQNALLQCRDVREIEVCYTTTAPCIHCMKLLLNTGCDKIVFIEPYDPLAVELWQRAGRVLTQYVLT